MATVQDVQTAAAEVIAASTAAATAATQLEASRALVDADIAPELAAMTIATTAYDAAFAVAKGAHGFDVAAADLVAAQDREGLARDALATVAREYLLENG